MPAKNDDLEPQSEAIANAVAAYATANMAAFKVLILRLQADGVLQPGGFSEDLRQFMESQTDADPAVISILQDLRMALLD